MFVRCYLDFHHTIEPYFSLWPCPLESVQVPSRCFLVDAYVMVPQWGKDPTRGGIGVQVPGSPWHVAINAVIGQWLAEIIAKAAMFLVVAFQASLGEQSGLTPFVLVRVMTFDAAHFGMFETLAQTQPSDLVASVNSVRRRVAILEHVIVVFESIARSKLKRSAIIHPFVCSMALPTHIHLSLS